MSKRNDQPAPVNPTAWVQMEDETLTTNKAAATIPLGIGEFKTTGRWLTPIYGQRAVTVPVPQQGGK